MAKIIPFNGITKLDLEPAAVLKQLLKRDDLEGLVIMGYTKEGDQFFSSTYADGGTCLWLIEQCKRKLLEVQP